MNLKLKRIAPLQAGKMLAALYALLSLFVIPFMLAFMAFGALAARSQGGANLPAFPPMIGMGLGAGLMIVVMPVLYAVMGFLFGVIGAAVYNLLAGWMGGFEFDFEAKAPPAL